MNVHPEQNRELFKQFIIPVETTPDRLLHHMKEYEQVEKFIIQMALKGNWDKRYDRNKDKYREGKRLTWEESSQLAGIDSLALLYHYPQLFQPYGFGSNFRLLQAMKYKTQLADTLPRNPRSALIIGSGFTAPEVSALMVADPTDNQVMEFIADMRALPSIESIAKLDLLSKPPKRSVPYFQGTHITAIEPSKIEVEVGRRMMDEANTPVDSVTIYEQTIGEWLLDNVNGTQYDTVWWNRFDPRIFGRGNSRNIAASVPELFDKVSPSGLVIFTSSTSGHHEGEKERREILQRTNASLPANFRGISGPPIFIASHLNNPRSQDSLLFCAGAGLTSGILAAQRI